MSDQSLQEKMSDQKEELEAIIERHLKFIDKLIQDKKGLNSQVEELMTRVQELESGNGEIIKNVKETFARELRNNKEAWIAAEKLWKTKFIDDKTKEIKKMTIKGLEPEIERILKNSRKKIREL